MKTTRPPLERMMVIAKKLREKSFFNAFSLADEFEVTHKTIQRDIDFMRDRLGYEITYDFSLNSYIGQPTKERVL